MLRVLSALVLAVAGLATFGTAASPAQAIVTPPPPPPVATVSFKNVATGQCLGLVQVGRHGSITVADCTFAGNQLFTEASPLSASRSWLVLDSSGGCLDLDVTPNLAFGTDQCGTVTLPTGQQAPNPALYWTRSDLGNGTIQLLGNGNHPLGFSTGTWFAGSAGSAPTPQTTWTVIPQGAA
jgi:hypothetical protein